MRDSAQKLDALSAGLPFLACRGLCQASCGAIRVHEAEQARLPRRMSYGPDLRCTFLDRDTGRCEVYTARPTLCRLFGVVRSMTCPHGCMPERMMTDEEGRAVLQQVAVVAGPLLPLVADPDVPAWIAEAMQR